MTLFFVHKCSHFSDKNKLASLFYITFPEINAKNLKYFGNASRKSGLGSYFHSLQELLKSSRAAWIREKYLVQTITILLKTLWSALWPSQGPVAQETYVGACLLLTPLLSTPTLQSRPQASASSLELCLIFSLSSLELSRGPKGQKKQQSHQSLD